MTHRIDEDDYNIEHVVYQSEPGFGIAAAFFKPRTPRADGQAVLALHGDGDGIDDPRYGYIREFARRGYYVLAPELRDFGRRRDADIDCHGAQDIMVLFGKNLLGQLIWECRRSLDYLVSREEVNPQFIGVCGMDFGAQLAMFLSGLDARIACCGMCGFLTTLRDACFHRQSYDSVLMPNIMHYCDISDIAGLTAPRPLLVQLAQEDSSVNHRDALRAYSQVERIYEETGHPDTIQLSTIPGALRFEGEDFYAWFTRWLAPR